MSVTEAHLGAVGRYVVVAPDDDTDGRAAVEKVTSWLVPGEEWRLRFRSLEEIVNAALGLGEPELATWAKAFGQRYFLR